MGEESQDVVVVKLKLKVAGCLEGRKSGQVKGLESGVKGFVVIRCRPAARLCAALPPT